MPYVRAPSGLLVWEGRRTPKEEIEFYNRVMGDVKSFPSTNRRREKSVDDDEPAPPSPPDKAT